MVMKRYELQDIAQLLERNAPEIASPIAEKRQVYKLIWARIQNNVPL